MIFNFSILVQYSIYFVVDHTNVKPAEKHSEEILCGKHTCEYVIHFMQYSMKKYSKLSLKFQIHTGEKPYKCIEENCDRAYAYQTDLKRHRRSVHGIITKTFPCPICSKVFYENKFLTKHLNVHQGNA